MATKTVVGSYGGTAVLPKKVTVYSDGSTSSSSSTTTAPTSSTRTSSGGSSSSSTKPVSQMTVAEAAAAGKTAEYNQLVSSYFPGGVVAPLDAGGGKTYSQLAGSTNIATAGITTPYTIPPAPASNMTGTGLAAGVKATTPVTAAPPASTTVPSTYDKFIESLGVEEAAEPEKIDKAKMERKAGIPAIQARVNDLKAQIDMETAQTQANLLKESGSASVEGGTEAIFGGRQAQIERESAIRLLPLTAMYQAELGNLTTAKELVSTFIADENAYQDRLYAWRKDIRDNAISYGTAQQQRQFELQDKADALATDQIKTNNASREKWASDAFDAGNSVTAGAILRLDPASPNFESDLAGLTSSLPSKTTTTSGSADYAKAQQFIADNPNATQAELEAEIRKYTKLTEADIKFLVGKEKMTPFLTKEFFTTVIPDEKLKTAAEEAGYRSFWSSWATEKENYLNYLVKTVEEYRKTGLSDEEILKQLQ